MIFDSKAKAEKQLLEFEAQGGMRHGSKIFEIAKAFEIEIVKVAKSKERKPSDLKESEEIPF